MKNFSVIIIAIILSVFAAYGTVKMAASNDVSVSSLKKESAYDRVIRTGTIRCGYMIWPPYFQKDQKTGELSGLVKEAVDEIFGTMGIKVEYVEGILGQQPQDLKADKYDSFCFDSFLMPKAAKFLDYSKPWMKVPMFLHGRQEFQAPSSISQLNANNYSFSALDGDLSSELAIRLFPTARLFSLPATADPSLIMLNVATKKADLAIIDALSVFKFNATNEQKLIKLYDHPVALYPINFSVDKGQVDLQNMINYGVDIFVYTGRYDYLFEKYDPNNKFFVRIKE